MRYGVFNKVLDKHLNKCMPTPVFDYTIDLFVDGKPFKVLSVNTLVREGDYYNTMFEKAKVLIAVEASTKNNVISKAFDLVTATITSRVHGKVMSSKNYKAFVHDIVDKDMKAYTKEMDTSYRQDDLAIGWVQLELLDTAGWDLRTREVGFTLPSTDPLNACKYILAKNKLRDLYSMKDFVFSMNFDEEEQTTFNTIVVKDGTKFLDVFDYIQNHYGIYSRGMGIFYNRQQWSMFRPYNVDKFDEGGKRLVIYNVPQDQMGEIPSNFYIEKDITYLAVTGETLIDNKIDTTAYNGGTGVRFNDVRSLEHKQQLEVKAGIYEKNPAQYLTQVNTNPLANVVNAPFSDEVFTDNPKKYRSKARRDRGIVVTVLWENGLYQLLEPGMGVKTLYPSRDGIKTITGTLLGVVEVAKPIGGGFHETTFTSQLALTLMLFPYK